MSLSSEGAWLRGVIACFGDSLGVSGGEMGKTPVGEPAMRISSSLILRGDGVGLLVLLPGGGRIRLSSSSLEKLFSRYSLPWDLYM